MNVFPTDAAAFWTMIGSLVAVLTLFGAVGVTGFRSLRRGIEANIREQFEPLRLQNERLRDELESRYRFPTYAKEVIELSEVATTQKIEQLKAQYEAALQEKDQARAEELEAQLSEVERLQLEMQQLSSEREELKERLRSLMVVRPPHQGTNGISLPTGMILFVRHQRKYGAVLAVDQASSSRGSFIRYVWWYQPDGTGNLVNANAQTGFAETREAYPGPSPRLHIGPIVLEWSVGGDGVGWVYYGPSSSPSPDYEFALSRIHDISKIDASTLPFSTAPSFQTQ